VPVDDVVTAGGVSHVFADVTLSHTALRHVTADHRAQHVYAVAQQRVCVLQISSLLHRVQHCRVSQKPPVYTRDILCRGPALTTNEIRYVLPVCR